MKRKKNSAFGFAAALLISMLLVLVLAICGIVYVRSIKPWQMRQQYILEYEEIIAEQCALYELDPYMVSAMIYCESRYKPDVVSNVGAKGLMQLMPDTADWVAWRLGWDGFDHERLFDPRTNIAMGCYYLSFLKERFDGDPSCMIAAYHCGQTQLERWLEDPCYSEDGRHITALPENDTNKYLKWVLSVYEIYEDLYPEIG